MFIVRKQKRKENVLQRGIESEGENPSGTCSISQKNIRCENTSTDGSQRYNIENSRAMNLM